jgi:hypothetical protein
MGDPGAQQQPEQPQASPGGAQGGDSNSEFEPIRSIAQALAAYAHEHQEATEEITQIFPLLQRVMARVAGNPSRTPEKPAPPQG